MSAAQTFDLTGGEEIDEDLFGTGEEGSEAEHTLSADDEYFDRVVAALEDIIMDDLYKQKVIKFCRDNCKHFDYGDENKLIYMQLFKQYTEITEGLIEEQLSAQVKDFDMERFETLLAERADELQGDVFDILMSLGDFEEFKSLMQSYRDQMEYEEEQEMKRKGKGGKSASATAAAGGGSGAEAGAAAGGKKKGSSSKAGASDLADLLSVHSAPAAAATAAAAAAGTGSSSSSSFLSLSGSAAAAGPSAASAAGKGVAVQVSWPAFAGAAESKLGEAEEEEEDLGGDDSSGEGKEEEEEGDISMSSIGSASRGPPSPHKEAAGLRITGTLLSPTKAMAGLKF